MIVIYSSTQEAKLSIVTFLQSQTEESIAAAQCADEIIPLARIHRPKKIFIFMPMRTAEAMDIQTYLRELIPYVRVRILPSVYGTEHLLNEWKNVVAKALRPRGVFKRTAKVNGK